MIGKTPTTSNISTCSSLLELHEMVIHLKSKKQTNIKGNTVLVIPEGLLRISILRSKFIELYNKELKEHSQDPWIVYEEAASLLYDMTQVGKSNPKVKKVIEQQFTSTQNVKAIDKACHEKILQNKELMKTLANNYDQLAIEVNQIIDDEVDIDLSDRIEKLLFLNTFLGIKLDTLQREGKCKLPLLRQEVDVSPPRSLNPADCGSLASLYSLVIQLENSEDRITFHDI